jgi:tetratricopeptide (TPR) repeat protein
MKRRVNGRRIALSLFIVCLLSLFTPQQAHASLPYFTLSSDSTGRWIWTPDAFVPVDVWTGFKDPEDLFITPEDKLYVADTGNDRIVELTAEGKVVRTFPDASRVKDGKATDPKEQLRKPEGVFVTKSGEIYVADTGGRRIVVFGADGKFAREYLEPKDPSMSKSYSFIPSKLVLDRRGYMFVANKGGYQGLLQMTPEGQFAGFFGTNKVPLNWIESMKRKFYTDEQMKEEQVRLPGAVTNLAVDAYGFIYTVNRDLPKGQLRRLNSGGVDLLKEHDFAPWIVPPNKFSFSAVSVDKQGIITVLEATRGHIYQYDTHGNLLFRFGESSDGTQRKGVFKRATGIAVLSNGNILISDGELNDIQLFKKTQFGSLVHDAVNLFSDGQYEQSEGYWRQILLKNADYNRAYQGIGKAEYYKGNYESAMTYFRTALDPHGYSDSYWQLRMNWLLKYFALIMTPLLSLLILIPIVRFILRKLGWWVPRKKLKVTVDRTKLNGWKQSIVQSFRILRHPVEGMVEISEGMPFKFLLSVILVILGFAVSLLGKAIANFVFSPVRFEELNLWSELQSFLLPWATWVVCSYLVGSVLKGQGTFKRVFIVNSLALMPMILINLPTQLLSRVLTLQEGIIYSLLTKGMEIWMLVLIFIGTMTVQNYNLKEALKMISVSVFTLACFWVFGFVLIGLLYQAVDFFMRIGQELIDRVV